MTETQLPPGRTDNRRACKMGADRPTPEDSPPPAIAYATATPAAPVARGEMPPNVQLDLERGGEHAVVLELLPSGDAILAKLLLGVFDRALGNDGTFQYRATVAADAAPGVASATAAYDAALAALPGMVEATRLGSVAAGYQAKLVDLNAAAAALKEKIVAAAAKADLGKADRDTLATVTADIEAHEDVLRVARELLDATKARLATDKRALAIEHRTAAHAEFEWRLTEVRDEILSLEPLWDALHGLTVAGAVNRQLYNRLTAIIGS
jgi:hypothetical protein